MPQDSRPDPDALLRQIQREEEIDRKGRLKIFFGACAGVGKTFAMLSAAHERMAEGIDVVVGLVETHRRTETERLVQGLSVLPPRVITHREVELKEFDLDAALSRKPQLILIDELAHTNAPGSRHPKRWQDVEELLADGIDVYTTLNVQHLESLNDIVASITGIWVKETVPDSIFDQADEISLVDIPSEDLLKRLKEGKVYIAPQAKERAAENFFKKNNLIALRELALRRTAERVDAQIKIQAPVAGDKEAVALSERIMVCIGADPLSLKLVRSAKRLATALKAPWVAVYVENDRHYRMTKAQQDTVERNLSLAEQMGGKAEIIKGDDAVGAILDYARSHGISKIVAGKTKKPRWREWLYGALVDHLVRRSGVIDVYVITGDGDTSPAPHKEPEKTRLPWEDHLTSAVVTLGCTLLAVILDPYLDQVNLLMIYLVGIIAVAARFGRGPAVLASLLSILLFDYFFVLQYRFFSVANTQYLISFVAILLTGLLIGSQSGKLKRQAYFSQRREKNISRLFSLTKELAATRGRKNIADTAARQMADLFDAVIAVCLPDASGYLEKISSGKTAGITIKEEMVIKWAYEHGQNAGRGTSTMPSASALYVPLIAGDETIGVLGVIPNDQERVFSAEQLESLETFASLIASALERVHAGDMAERSRLEAESEKLRNILLSSVSHDLRTPLASITGAASMLLIESGKITELTRKELLRTIHEEAVRLAKIVTNLLDVTSLEAGNVKLNRQPYFIEELIGSALMRTEERLSGRPVRVDVPPGLPMVLIDGLLIDQVLVNILENVGRFTPPEAPVLISALLDDKEIIISVTDKGPGVPPDEVDRIFEKFYAGSQQHDHGSGLGLAICRGIVRAHGGRIWVENASEGGAIFRFTLPIVQKY